MPICAILAFTEFHNIPTQTIFNFVQKLISYLPNYYLDISAKTYTLPPFLRFDLLNKIMQQPIKCYLGPAKDHFKFSRLRHYRFRVRGDP